MQTMLAFGLCALQARDAVTGRALGSTYTVRDEAKGGSEGAAAGVFERGAAGIDAPDWCALSHSVGHIALNS